MRDHKTLLADLQHALDSSNGAGLVGDSDAVEKATVKGQAIVNELAEYWGVTQWGSLEKRAYDRGVERERERIISFIKSGRP